MCPLSIFADEMAREEVCEIVPGVYQSNWKGQYLKLVILVRQLEVSVPNVSALSHKALRSGHTSKRSV